MSATFPTITSQDWVRECFSASRREGQRQGSVILAQIRAAMREKYPAPFTLRHGSAAGVVSGVQGCSCAPVAHSLSEPTESKLKANVSGADARETVGALVLGRIERQAGETATIFAGGSLSRAEAGPESLDAEKCREALAP